MRVYLRLFGANPKLTALLNRFIAYNVTTYICLYNVVIFDVASSLE